jgi:hypothetical protein
VNNVANDGSDPCGRRRLTEEPGLDAACVGIVAHLYGDLGSRIEVLAARLRQRGKVLLSASQLRPGIVERDRHGAPRLVRAYQRQEAPRRSSLGRPALSLCAGESRRDRFGDQSQLHEDAMLAADEQAGAWTRPRVWVANAVAR